MSWRLDVPAATASSGGAPSSEGRGCDAALTVEFVRAAVKNRSNMCADVRVDM